MSILAVVFSFVALLLSISSRVYSEHTRETTGRFAMALGFNLNWGLHMYSEDKEDSIDRKYRQLRNDYEGLLSHLGLEMFEGREIRKIK